MPNGKVIGVLHQKPVGYIIDREKFEKHLARRSKSEIKLNREVVNIRLHNQQWEVITKTGEIFHSKYLIGADGFNSIVRRKVFPENKEKIEFIPAFEYFVEVEKELNTKTIKIYFDNDRYDNGYAWVFPKSRKRVNIGLGGDGDLPELFDDFLINKIKKYYGNYQYLENRSGTVAVQHKGFKFFKSNVFLVGDAAGLVDPIFKGGMNQAMYSGKIAAECLLKNKAKLYEKKMKSMPFTNASLIDARDIFYSLDNQTLNKLGEIMENKSTAYLKTLSGFMKILSENSLRKNIFKLFKFFSIWQKNEDYLW